MIEALPPPVFDRVRRADPEAVEDFFRSAYRASMHPCMAGLDLAATNYLLCATQARKNKNLWTLVRAYRDLVRRDRILHKLFLTTDLPADIAEWLHREGLSIDVLAWRSVPEGVLGEMFRHADVVVVPSLFEGGIPLNLLEANACGVPVALAAMPTVTTLCGFDGRATACFYPSDEAGMRRAIHACLADPQAVVEEQRKLLAANPVVRDWPAYAATIFSVSADFAGPTA
jgi:glycosyltransferase involved in cell wall biosynthesis